jgi:hypothetical protein
MDGAYTELNAIVVVQNLTSHYPAAHPSLDKQPSFLYPQGIVDPISRQKYWTVACAILSR